MRKKFNIVITTFSKRYEFIEKLIPQIRGYVDNKIIIIINGEKDGDFNEEYRKKVLTLCANNSNVYPVFYIETRGLSKMWNTGLITSDLVDVLMLNDDIEITTNEIFIKTDEQINSPQYKGLTKFNYSFSHFIVNKILMDKIGYFDERLLGFGEEDGDITYRLLKEGINVDNIEVRGVLNIVSNIRHEHITAGIGKYSNFNREFIYKYKYAEDKTSPFKGMFDTPMKENLTNYHQYPYEPFFNINKEHL